MIERKITITSCNECPFCDWTTKTKWKKGDENSEIIATIKYFGHWKCTKYGFIIEGKTYSNNKIEDKCMLPTNIPSKHIK